MSSFPSLNTLSFEFGVHLVLGPFGIECIEEGKRVMMKWRSTGQEMNGPTANFNPTTTTPSDWKSDGDSKNFTVQHFALNQTNDFK